MFHFTADTSDCLHHAIAEITMEYVVVLSATAFLLWWIIGRTSSRPKNSSSNLPGPTFLDYMIPGSLLNQILINPRKLSRLLFNLHDKYGDVFRLPQGLYMTVATTNPDDVTFITSNNTALVKPPGVHFTLQDTAPGNLFVLTGADHHHMRKHLQKTFNSSLLPNFHHIMADCILEGSSVLTKLIHLIQTGPQKLQGEDLTLYNTFVSHGYLNISAILNIITLRAITSVCFGASLSVERRRSFLDVVENISNEMLNDVMFHPVRKYAQMVPIIGPYFSRGTMCSLQQQIRNYCREFVAARVAEWNDPSIEKPAQCRDLADAILMANQDDVEFIITHTMTFALAGSLSTNHTIAWAFYELSKPENKVAYERLQREVDEASKHLSDDECMDYDSIGKLEYVRAVWKETLRLHPALYGVTRQTTEDVVLPGSKTQVAKGTVVQALTYITQCDERYFDNAWSFQPQRWLEHSESRGRRRPLGAYVPFGLGSHNCAGQFFAEHEGAFVLAEMSRRFNFSLSCKPDEVVVSSGFVEVPKFSSGSNGILDMGVPVVASKRL